MNGLIASPFIEGIVELLIGGAFVLVSHLAGAPELQPVGMLIIGGGLMSLGLTKVNNQGAK